MHQRVRHLLTKGVCQEVPDKTSVNLLAMDVSDWQILLGMNHRGTGRGT